MLAAKSIEKTLDATNTKQYYQSYVNTKLVKRSKIISQQLKTFEHPNFVDIKSVTIKHPKTSHKFFKTIRQAEKVSQVGSGKSFECCLFSEAKKVRIF